MPVQSTQHGKRQVTAETASEASEALEAVTQDVLQTSREGYETSRA